MKSSWPYVKLKDCCTVVSGATPRRDTPEYWGGNIAWVTPKDLGNLTEPVLADTPEKITEAGLRSCSATMLPVGSVLFSSRAPIGLVAITGREMCTNQGFKSLVPGKGVAGTYLYWCMRHMTPQLAHLGRGATFKEVSKEIVDEFEIPLPPLPEQRRIAAILDKADAIRRKRRETIRLTDDFLRSVFLDMFGPYIAKDADTQFGRLLAEPLINGFFAKSDVYSEGVPVVWVDNLYHTMSISTENLRRARMAGPDLEKYEVLEGDLLFTRSSLVAEGVGQINIVPALHERTAFECHIIRARVDRRRLDPSYVLGLYRSTFGKQHIQRQANTATMTTISQGALERLPCPVPPLHLQEQYAKIVRQTERFRSSAERGAAADEELMGTLSQRAFKGEL
jgi:type I restriction enzyme S subunit